MFTRIKIDYNGYSVDAILLAKFSMKREIYIKEKILWITKQSIYSKIDSANMCLIYIPWKYKSKEIAVINQKFIISSSCDFIDNDNIIKIDNFETTHEDNSRLINTHITNFEGYDFLYTKDLIDGLEIFKMKKCLTALYNQFPQVLNDEFDDEKIIDNIFLTSQFRNGSAYIEFQYYEKETTKNVYKNIEHFKLNSLFVSIDSIEHFLDLYFDFFNPCCDHIFDEYGVNYYTQEQSESIYKFIKEADIKGSGDLLAWIQKAYTNHNGFYILGI